MRFLSIYRAVERNTPPTAEHIAAMGQLIEESMRAGELIATEGCLPSALGAKVRLSGYAISVTDGPFTESKEVIGGFALLEASSKEEAIEMARKFLRIAGEGECEIRQVFTAPESVPADAVEQQAFMAAQYAKS
jgi:hypothetical protein